jgi:hypothetical protein
MNPQTLIVIAEIAKQMLCIETLETRNSDSLDFHDLAIWSVREALVAACEAGRQSAPRDKDDHPQEAPKKRR